MRQNKITLKEEEEMQKAELELRYNKAKSDLSQAYSNMCLYGLALELKKEKIQNDVCWIMPFTPLMEKKVEEVEEDNKNDKKEE